MKHAVILALILAPLACADQTTKVAKVEQLLTVMNVEQQQKEIMGQMWQMVKSQLMQTGGSQEDTAKLEAVQKRLFALIQEKTSWQNMKPVYIKVYSETFTETEIDGIIAFYKSPAGQAMVQKTPTLMQKTMTAMQGVMSDIMPQIQQIIKDVQ